MATTTTVIDQRGGTPFVIRVLWFLIAGWWLSFFWISLAALANLTIIGIPLGLANFKMIPVSLMPLGREIV